MSLLAKVAKIQRPRRRSWFDQLTAAQQKDLTELRTAWKAGTLTDASGVSPTKSSLLALVQAELKIVVKPTTFQDWLRS